MRIKVERKWKKATYTIGRLYVDGLYYFETLEELTTFNCWDPELGVYLVRTISKVSLEESVSKGIMFLFAGEYCNALNPQTNKPYAVWNS